MMPKISSPSLLMCPVCAKPSPSIDWKWGLCPHCGADFPMREQHSLLRTLERQAKEWEKPLETPSYKPLPIPGEATPPLCKDCAIPMSRSSETGKDKWVCPCGWEEFPVEVDGKRMRCRLWWPPKG